jgi:site-specific DNA recombinase
MLASMTKPQRRAVGVIRLSKMTDETTSPARQRELIEHKAADRGATIVGWAQDDDVSATKYAPHKRPALKKWLDRPGEYDEIIFWRQDRFVRKVRDLVDMIDWARAHGKGLVSATESFDLDDPNGQGEAMATMAAMFAQMEARTTSIRVTGAHAFLRESGRWQGGNFPYGYRAIPNPDGPGLVLVQDEHSAGIVREAIGRVIRGESVQSIAADFNRREILCPQDYARMLKAKPLRCECKHEKRDHGPACVSCECTAYAELRQEWARSSLHRVLRSEALLGRVLHDGRAVISDDGMPIVRTEPLIDLATWAELQQALTDATKTRRRTQTPSALLNIAFCGCGQPLFKWQKPNKQGRVYQYYRCRENYRRTDDPQRCNERPVPCEILDMMVHSALLREIGKFKVMRREIKPGDGHERELAAVGQQIADLTTERFVKGIIRPDFDKLMAALQAEHARLADLPPSPDVLTKVPTGQTFAQRWESMTGQERRLWLRDSGVTVHAPRGAWPPFPDTAGPLTPGDVPRVILEERGDVYAVINLGGLRALLERASAA